MNNKNTILSLTIQSTLDLSPSDNIFMTNTTNNSLDNWIVDYDPSDSITLGPSNYWEGAYIQKPLINQKSTLGSLKELLDMLETLNDIKKFSKSNAKVDISDAVASIADNGAYLPEIKKIIFNDPSTIVFFADGTKSVVTASKADPFSKELGIVYAIVKRIIGTPDKNGNIKYSNGYLKFIKSLIEKAYDQKEAKLHKTAK